MKSKIRNIMVLIAATVAFSGATATSQGAMVVTDVQIFTVLQLPPAVPPQAGGAPPPECLPGSSCVR